MVIATATATKRQTRASKAELVAQTLLDHTRYIETLLMVRTKEGRAVPFQLTDIQRRVAGDETRRNVKLKPRQVGMSTWEVAKRVARVCTRTNWTAVTVAHRADVTEQLFQTAHFFYKNLPPQFQPKTQYSNRKELYFPGLDSRYIIFTEGGPDGVGHGVTVNDLHCSEVAYWRDPDKILGGLLEATPKDAYVDFESTANGSGTWWQNFYEEAKNGLNGYKAFFFPWWWQKEYQLSDQEARAFDIDPDKPLEDELERAKEEQLVTRYNLTRQQINWRRWKKATLKHLFDQVYPEDDATCFLTSGNSYFDKETLDRAKLIGERPPIRTTDNGRLKVWDEPLEEGQYLMAADVAEGVKDGDYSAAYVIDGSTGEQVAALHGHYSTHSYALALAELGHLYNTAQLVVERNNHGHAVLATLIYELAYPNVYHHRDYDAKGDGVEKPGYPTTSKTKPIALMAAKQMLEDAPEAMHDAGFFAECRTFVEHEDGSIGAIANCHDDRVMAAAIGRAVWRSYKPVIKTSIGAIDSVSRALGGDDTLQGPQSILERLRH